MKTVSVMETLASGFEKMNLLFLDQERGNSQKLTKEHYALVTDYKCGKNAICSTGSIIASSKSLTHAMIYEHASDVHAVMHVIDWQVLF